MADMLTDVYFAPTPIAKETLIDEGVLEQDIIVTGNTVIDALKNAAEMPYSWSKGPLSSIPQEKRIVLITIHRRESFGLQLIQILLAIKDLTVKYSDSDLIFVYPVHLNPNVQESARKILNGIDNLFLINPLDYLSLVNLMKRSVLIITDSGGLQEEAPYFGIPVLIVRDVTERVEGVQAGTAKLVGTRRTRIIYEFDRLLSDSVAYSKMAKILNLYGDGHAASRIVMALMERS